VNATPLTGDFDGDGVDEAAIFVGGQWFVDLNGNGRWDAGDLWIQLGTELDRPVVGDWDGAGKDDIGIFGRQWQRDPQKIIRDPGLPDPANKRRRQVDSRSAASRGEDRGNDRLRLLRRGNDGSLRADAVDHIFQYGEQVDTPIAGDWNGDGIDQIAVFRGGKWLLDADGDGRWTPLDEIADYGRPGDVPIVGDFNGDDIDEIGVVRGEMWIIDTDGDRRITGNDLQINVPRENGDSQPVVGDFDGDGKDEPGYYDEAA
jgi:serine-aspartate repeat-containing protein C/D/E